MKDFLSSLRRGGDQDVPPVVFVQSDYNGFSRPLGIRVSNREQELIREKKRHLLLNEHIRDLVSRDADVGIALFVQKLHRLLISIEHHGSLYWMIAFLLFLRPWF